MIRFTKLSIKKFKNLFIAMILLSLPLEQALAQHDGRYAFNYPRDFFSSGGKEVEFNTSVRNKIGVLVTNRTTRMLSEITRMIFSAPPFDRYKQVFYFRIEDEFREDMANNNTISTRAYDYNGRPINSGLSISEGQGSFNLFFLKFGIKEVIKCSCNGATIHTNQGNFSFAGENDSI
ncbi:MAG: hypothetical protein AABY49_05645 [Planctomycetota bacterium]